MFDSTSGCADALLSARGPAATRSSADSVHDDGVDRRDGVLIVTVTRPAGTDWMPVVRDRSGSVVATAVTGSCMMWSGVTLTRAGKNYRPRMLPAADGLLPRPHRISEEPTMGP